MALPGRTTSVAVAKLVEVDEDFDLEQFIDVANELVTEVCVPAGYSDHRLELIERWLSAHFYQILDQGTVAEKVGSIRQQFKSKVDLGFDVTHYGQQVMRLDTAGGLARLNNRIKKGLGSVNLPAGIRWLGSDYCDLYP